VFARPADREAIERVAAAAQVPFAGVWLEAPESVLIARSEQRHLDASDADAAVIQKQLAGDTGAVTWHRTNASRAPDDVLRATVHTLERHLEGGIVRLESQAASGR
jgi:predicted kinase